jgi:hypothetical protein
MPARASLKPVKNKSRERDGISAWCLSVPSELSPTGKRQRLFYPTEKEAKVESERIKARRHNFGHSIAALTPARIDEAAKAFELLDKHGLGLIDAVNLYIQTHKQRISSVSFAKLFDEFIAAKSGKTPHYQVGLRHARNRFPSLHDRLVSDILPSDLEPLFAAIPNGGLGAVMRYLKAAFFFGIRKGYLVDNPISKLDFPERKRKEVEVFSNKQIEAMLLHALQHDLKLLPFLTLATFAGVRPDGELQKLEWSDVKLAEKTIVIRPEVSKTNRRRFVDLSANAIAWLTSYRRAGGAFDGKVVKYTSGELRTHRRANRKAAGITKWIQQGMRHTFCSNWLAVHKNVNALVLQSGHSSSAVMWEHYHHGVAESEAKKFWKIGPPKQARKPKNVIQMVA